MNAAKPTNSGDQTANDPKGGADATSVVRVTNAPDRLANAVYVTESEAVNVVTVQVSVEAGSTEKSL